MNKYLSFTIIIFLGLLSFSCSNDDVRGGDIPPPQRGKIIKLNEGKSILDSYSGSYALLIGESDYTNGWSDLNSIPRELVRVETVLKAQGFEVEKSLNLNASKLEARFRKFINDYGYKPNNRLLFFYSGHGHTDGGQGFLVPTDAPDPDKDIEGFLKKSLVMTDITALARRMRAKHVLFLFDSCFSGSVFKAKERPKVPRQITKLANEPVRQFITAGSEDETVPANSVFTPAFVDALEYGLGDMSGDGYITGQELGLYLQGEVPQHNTRQTPQYGKISDYKLSRGDFVFFVGTKSQQVAQVSTNTGQDAEIARLKREKAEAEARAERERQARIAAENSAKQDARKQAEIKRLREEKAQADAKAERERKARIAAEKRRKQNSKFFRDTLKDGSKGPEMVRIPAGSFKMGSKYYHDEIPAHQVSLSAFSIGKYEVTFAEYDNFANATGRSKPSDSGWGRGNRPVINVSWHDAVAYAKWLSKQTSKKYRLPTEAEWEYAARAGTTTEYSFSNDGSLGDYAWYVPNSSLKTHPVGEKEPNAWKLHDVHGNVWELVHDVYDSSYYNRSPRSNPRGSSGGRHGSSRVMRGGSWRGSAGHLRTAARYQYSPESRNYSVGFRLVSQP